MPAPTCHLYVFTVEMAACRCNIEATLAGFDSYSASIAELTAAMHDADSHFAVYTEHDVRQACLELSGRGRQLNLRCSEWLSYAMTGDLVSMHYHGDATPQSAQAMVDLS
jgi:hypothetical protein